MSTKETMAALKGGEFVIKDSNIEEIFIPEQFDEEQLMIRDMVNDFVDNEITPHIAEIEKQKDGIVPKILDKAAELGLLGTH
ncbi:MAG TPA: acyl-CoA dehydrogenase family protein, partial [Saprospiraceae bacterium]|nr:acyl-CoA dehydrogenase family protein [Saprospiraceae bacterium]